MNKYKDSDLREALRRREAKRPKTEVPGDFCDRVMQEIEKREMKKRRAWLYPSIAAAACALLLLTIHFGRIPSERQDVTRQPTIAEKIHSKDMKTTPAVVAIQDEYREDVLTKKNSVIRKMSERDKTTSTDSLLKQIAWIESELERVGDSVYMDRLTRTIIYDPELSKIVNDFFITTSDTLLNNDSIKTI